MSLSYKHRAKLCLLALLLSAACGSAETLEDYRPLLDNSPFLTRAFKDRLAKSEATGIKNYTFVGYTRSDRGWKLCLINKKTNLATWVELDDEVEGYVLKEFVAKSQQLTFEKNGITANLTLEKPK